MTYQELQAKIAEVNRLVDVRYQGACDNYQKYWLECRDNGKIAVKNRPLRSEFERMAFVTTEKLRKEYAMQETPADIGDIIQADKLIMRIKSIGVSPKEPPTLHFFGTYLKRDLTPQARQPRTPKPIRQEYITKVLKSAPHQNH